ncbi:uncharacterized protein [Physcomitrium patens]|uniref:uncharacterized protein isoform X2 n=1 Tax=Physcomitrium patens TaxID=3218 RepID=UPI003CCD01C9
MFIHFVARGGGRRRHLCVVVSGDGQVVLSLLLLLLHRRRRSCFTHSHKCCCCCYYYSIPGGMRGRSVFDVFDNNPFFNDPFFTRSFGGIFGGQGLFGNQQGFLGGNFFQNQIATRPHVPPGNYIEDRPYSPPQVHQRGPIIEELSDSDADTEARVSSHPGQQPIIEHPDDDVRPEPQEQLRPLQSVVKAGPLPVINNSSSFSSFQCSSVSYGGPNGTYYSSSAARRLGPDGSIEEEFQEKDSTSGHELKRVSRGLGVKGRTIARKRTSEGREHAMEILHNLQEDEVPAFERSWEERANVLPRWNRHRLHTIGASHGSSSRSRAPALVGRSPSQVVHPSNPN